MAVVLYSKHSSSSSSIFVKSSRRCEYGCVCFEEHVLNSTLVTELVSQLFDSFIDEDNVNAFVADMAKTRSMMIAVGCAIAIVIVCSPFVNCCR